MYLIVAKYADDAERKRIEYVFDKWSGRLQVSAPKGITAVVDGAADQSDVQELVRELYSRSSRGNVSLFKMEPVEFADIEREERDLTLELSEKRETVEKLIGFVMARQKALYKSGTPQAGSLYEVTSKKGKAEITVRLKESDGRVKLRLSIAGYGPVVDYLHGKLAEELKYF